MRAMFGRNKKKKEAAAQEALRLERERLDEELRARQVAEEELRQRQVRSCSLPFY